MVVDLEQQRSQEGNFHEVRSLLPGPNTRMSTVGPVNRTFAGVSLPMIHQFISYLGQYSIEIDMFEFRGFELVGKFPQGILSFENHPTWLFHKSNAGFGSKVVKNGRVMQVGEDQVV
jgi:hypothetical protein